MYKLLIISHYGPNLCQNVVEYDTPEGANTAYEKLQRLKFAGTMLVHKLY